MNMESISNLRKNGIYFFLFLWIITLPVRNSILSFSIAGGEIYPNLIGSFLLICLLIPSIFSLKKYQFIILLFLGSWLSYAVVKMILQGISVEAIFDIHSLLMQFSFAIILFGLYAIFSWDDFKLIIRNCLRFYLILLLTFGVIEFISLYHIVGPNVSKLAEYTFTLNLYAPFFIYDNVNDYCTYLTLLIGLLYLFDDQLQKNKWIPLLLSVILLVFAYLAESRIGKIISYVYIFFFAIQIVIPILKTCNKKTILYVFSFLTILLLMLFSNSFFSGQKHLSSPTRGLYSSFIISDNMDTIRPFKNLAPEKQEKLLTIFSKRKVETESHSTNIRVNLLKNGIDMTKAHPVLGQGPGSFRIQHKEGKFNYPTETISNPHNFVVEIIAQFGIFGWTYFGFLIYLIFRSFSSKNLTLERKLMIVLLIGLYPFIGLMPSSFLYINLHWLFLPLIAVLVLTKKEQVI